MKELCLITNENKIVFLDLKQCIDLYYDCLGNYPTMSKFANDKNLTIDSCYILIATVKNYLER